MEYQITIIKREKNPAYIKALNEQRSHPYIPMPVEFIEYQSLSFVATTEQFEAIRKAALGAM